MWRHGALMAITIAVSFGVARAALTRGERCAAGKEKAAGNAIATSLTCQVRAAATGKPLRSSCLRASRRRLKATFARLGKACPGAATDIATLIDEFCVPRLLGDLTGTGQCPIGAAKAVERAGRGILACAARALHGPGSLDACTARRKAALDAALSAAQRCVDPAAADDLQTQCIAPLLNALPPTVTCGTFLTTWASPNTTGIATDGGGNVYVSFASSIQKFDGSGTPLVTWGTSGSGPGQFAGAAGIAVNASGNVFVVDSGNGRIQRFDGTGTFVSAWSTPGSPSAIAAGDSGTIYVLDLTCTFPRTPCGLTIDEFDAKGSALGSLPVGSAFVFGQIDVTAFVVDGSGNIYVTTSALTDAFANQVRKLDSAGTLLATWGSNGSDPGQFSVTSGIALDAGGHVFVGDAGNGRIQEFDGTGRFLTAWSTLGQPTNIAVDPGGNVYVADGARLWKFACP